jgi:polyamine oxidase
MEQQQADRPKVKVIVVGAGAAGLGAARWLVDNDIHDNMEVVVLEARDRIGGRVHTAKEEAGEANQDALGLFDLGASWIHNHTEKNPMSIIAKTISSHVVETDWDSDVVVDNSGKKFPEKALDRGWRRFYEGMEREAHKARKKPAATMCDKSLEDLMLSYFGEEWNQPICQGYAASYDFLFGAPLYKCSATESIDADWLNAVDEDADFLLPTKGYGSVLDALVSGEATVNGVMSRPSKEASTATSSALKPLLVLTNNEVISVMLTENGNYAVTSNNGITSQASQLIADAVIITVPLGVLKSRSIAFSPELSAAKQEAIDRIGFGNVVKVVLEFPKIFWATHCQFLHVFDTANCNCEDQGNQRRGCLNYFLNGYAFAKKKILVTYGLGDMADYVENVRYYPFVLQCALNKYLLL